jgi:glycosyltransferase involved in cell wall biosynthesis
MKLGIISDAHHYYNAAQELCTLTPLARQFEQWARMFDSVLICAPLLPGDPPPAYRTVYRASNVELLPISHAGGDTLQAKFHLAGQVIAWWSALQMLLAQVDAVHVRCPNNISILGLLALQRAKLLRQAIYTGNWQGYPTEPLTYRMQRLFLKYLFRGPVAVYGEWPDQPSHVVPSFSPSYSRADWEMESVQVARRIERLRGQPHLPEPIHLISVGVLHRNKNQQVILHAMHHLLDQGIDCRLDLLGEGDQRPVLEELTKTLGLREWVMFHGNVSQSAVREFYRQAMFVIQPSYSEGFSKVPVEAFFHGAIPILSNVSTNPQIVGHGSRGRCFSPEDAKSISNHVRDLSSRPADMIRLIHNGREYAQSLTLEAWQQHLREMLNRHWKTQLPIYSEF